MKFGSYSYADLCGLQNEIILSKEFAPSVTWSELDKLPIYQFETFIESYNERMKKMKQERKKAKNKMKSNSGKI